MFIFIGIVIGFLFIVLIFLFIKYKLFARYIVDNFKSCNVLVYGAKGRGKDLLFQWVINKRKDYYYSNIDYGHKHKIIKIKDISVAPNTYENFINGEFEKIPHQFKDGKDFYLSDVGNFLPSYMDSTLHKKFPSLPIFYSLSRQLYDCNIHCNSQALLRPWKALREQGDFYIRCCYVIKLPFFLIIKVRSYDKFESAEKNLLPMKARFMNKYSKAQADLYNSTNGDIKAGYIFIKKSNINYDTRYFEKLLLKGKRK